MILGRNGDEGFRIHVKRKLRYPRAALDNNITGRVLFRFIVETDGSVSNIEILRSADPLLNHEAIRLIYLSNGKWKPGKQSGEPARVQIQSLVSFDSR